MFSTQSHEKEETRAGVPLGLVERLTTGEIKQQLEWDRKGLLALDGTLEPVCAPRELSIFRPHQHVGKWTPLSDLSRECQLGFLCEKNSH